MPLTTLKRLVAWLKIGYWRDKMAQFNDDKKNDSIKQVIGSQGVLREELKKKTKEVIEQNPDKTNEIIKNWLLKE